ncbi:hypothetical protein CH298_13205 [Rhodococcoides fascians]|uniref:hypothetical protein n=1 Tax=Rhodococcoides fascians TaxID=1828 RepID=UPI000B9A71EA|nr:hypothetical protein [Rhodococcus fascians]OZE89937.1 hypothetical protein CH303_13085 [Rhodococcus fascians]OZF18244.1 hypothetical protein CH298_13205 [Rhodococcus fascians]OZF21695.1 hypothetical protein CH297_13100 [Rhodococcus fascians]OZF67320.1 hypothetical protein CH308_13000 [Rhodococcus fascians]OZF70509.1 hypothetical protein CH307_13195 [Rhodococcus fascians]
MSLVQLQKTIEGYRRSAADLMDRYSREQADIAADATLTEIGKKEELGPLHEEVTAKVRALLAEEKIAVVRKREALEKLVFGITATNTNDIDSYRNAQDRAEALTDHDEAWTKYKSALRSNDKILAQAILGQALERGWTRITNDYCDRNPSTREALEDLKALNAYSNNTFGVSVHYMVPALSTTPTLPVPAVSSGQLASWMTNGGSQ